MTGRIAYVIGFGAPPVLELYILLDLMQQRGWNSYVVLSPTAAEWVEISRLEAASGHPVRSNPRPPFGTDPLPPADTIVVAPLTFNSLNKWAQGHSDTLALGILNESLGLHVPIIAAICAKDALRQHPAYPLSVAALVSAGVRFLAPSPFTRHDERLGIRSDWEALAPP